jgi:hypothetical protein
MIDHRLLRQNVKLFLREPLEEEICCIDTLALPLRS